MKVALLTCEYPPAVYGGAGIHVLHLARELAQVAEVDVHCFGSDRPPEADRTVVAHRPCERLMGEAAHLGALRAMSVDVQMAAKLGGVDIVHSHTWYTNFAGHLAKLLYDVPHVVTSHSLEPLRPWKAGQLGPGYRLSSFCEQVALGSADAVVAVSRAAATDICRCYPALDPDRVSVIYNAVDTDVFRPDRNTALVERFGIDLDAPIVFYSGRITPQKGISHLLDAAEQLDPSIQIVLRAGPADTPALAREMASRVGALTERRGNVGWIQSFLNRHELAQLLSHASVCCCPSIYEPFGMVNLEAMACEVPVVASAVGGVAEVVEDGVTGWLVPFEPAGPTSHEPADPRRFATDLAEAIYRVIGDPKRARDMGRAGRQRVQDHFSWPATARQTVALYDSLLPAAARLQPSALESSGA